MSKGFHALCTLCALTALGAQETYAQTEVRSHFGSMSGDLFGGAVASAGDVNADGVPDYIVGATELGMVFFEREGYATVYSGVDGSVIRTHSGLSNGQAFGVSVAGAGNTNPGSDAADDYVVGSQYYAAGSANARGRVFLYSGATGAERWTVTGSVNGDELGTVIHAGHDVNGDGIPDVIAGAPKGGANSGGYAVVLSGANGNQIHRLDGTSSNQRRGSAVCIVGSLNPGTDTNADYAVGSGGLGVTVRSGATGGLLYNLNGLSVNDGYGTTLAAIDDVTGDGIPELVVGAPQSNFLFPGTGYVEVRSGSNGALVFRKNGAATGEGFGARVAAAGDWNADGFEDVLVSSIAASGGANIVVTVISGLDGAILDTLMNGSVSDNEGKAIAGIGDADGDGKVEILLGAPNAGDTGLGAGRAVVYESPEGIPTGCVGGTSNFCSSLPNSTGNVATLTFAGSTSVATNNVVVVSNNLPTNQPGVFFYGNQSMNAPFGNGVRCVGGNKIARFSPSSTGPIGLAASQLNLNAIMDPNVQIVSGSTWYFQFWFRDPNGGGVNLSNGLQIDFCD